MTDQQKTTDVSGVGSNDWLAPCPFCGRDNGLDSYGSHNPSFPWAIRCCYCVSSGPQAKTLDQAKELWNVRANAALTGERKE